MTIWKQLAVVMSVLEVALPGQEKEAEKQKRAIAEEKRKADLEKQKAEELRIVEKKRKEAEARNLEDERKKMEASRSAEAREQEVEQRKIQEIEGMRIALELEGEMIWEKDAEKKEEKKKELEAAQKKASQETERRKKAQSTPVRIIGEGWVWVMGKKLRHMTAIALTKARFNRGHQTTFDTWNKIVMRAL